jgi:hypothetical protein
MCLSRTFVVAKNQTEAKLQATSTWGESTEPIQLLPDAILLYLVLINL